ncbi:Uu.00g037360.m01.CDS01 [Anthostomella pinea]|uniref:Uu.00g037360.m01.CDS01 n=1 Tax=Anthostomella pinea TaxID=933095 RepID=A0AAI8YDS4_9PEZI|nr:Uu.00g037360.m01.CDS01 [Anthostomella pinea]
MEPSRSGKTGSSTPTMQLSATTASASEKLFSMQELFDEVFVWLFNIVEEEAYGENSDSDEWLVGDDERYAMRDSFLAAYVSLMCCRQVCTQWHARISSSSKLQRLCWRIAGPIPQTTENELPTIELNPTLPALDAKEHYGFRSSAPSIFLAKGREFLAYLPLARKELYAAIHAFRSPVSIVDIFVSSYTEDTPLQYRAESKGPPYWKFCDADGDYLHEGCRLATYVNDTGITVGQLVISQMRPSGRIQVLHVSLSSLPSTSRRNVWQLWRPKSSTSQ